jgi:magnesium-transporting ATPase (P-type)
MATSTFRGIIDFLQTLGIYDVILPFLLVFTITYAIFDKTKVLGVDEVGNKKYSKKNLNAMAAFVIGFLVVASTKLVQLINTFLANIITVLILIVMFLLLIGAFYKNGEEVFLDGGWRIFMMVIVFITIILIFLNAIPTDDGSNWLAAGWKWLVNNWDSNAGGSVILVIVVILIMVWITSDKKEKSDHKEEKKKE